MFGLSPASAPRVLLVDDDEDTLTSTSMLLQKCGFEVETAQDGSLAVRLATRAHFDLVLIDLALPKLDGYAVARALKQRAELPSPLLVAVTGYGRREDVLRCADAGFDLHLTKPVDPTLLTRLPLLFERAESALRTGQRLAAEHRAVMASLLREQLRMAQACVDLAMGDIRPEARTQLLLRAARLCGRAAEKIAITGPQDAELVPRILAIQRSIASITYPSIDPQ